MPYSFIGSAFTPGSGTNNNTLTTSSSLVVNTNDTIIVALFSGDSTGNSPSDGNNTYTAAGSTASNIFYFYCVSAAAGTYAITGNFAGHGHAVAAFQYRGLSAFQNFTGHTGAPGNGVDAVNSGTASCTAAPAMVWGLAFDVTNFNNNSSNGVPTAGTSPLSFTNEGGFWQGGASTNNAISQDVRVTSTGNYAATAGSNGNSQFDTFYSAVMIFGEVVPPPPNIIGGQIFVTA